MSEHQKKKVELREVIAKLKKEKSLLKLIGVCFVLLMVCLVIGIYHVNRIYQVYGDTSYDFIFDRAQVTSKNFTEDFRRKGSMVESEAMVLSSLPTIGKDNICQGLQGLQTSGEFDYARYISTRGIKFRPDGSLNSIIMSDYAKYVDPNEEYSVFKNFDPEYSDDELCFASAVTNNGIVQGYVVGIVNASRLFESFDNDSSNSVAERYLVDNKGTIIIYTKGDDLFDGDNKNIYDLLTQNCLDDYDAENTKEEIKNQLIAEEMMRREVTIGANEGYVLFKELSGISGWAIFYIVYDHNVQTMIRPVLIESSISILVIMIFMACLTVFVMRYLSSEQKKMYELAFTDELTNAPNENAFLEKAETLLHEYPDQPYVVMCFDIVNFRYINEGYGHEKADMLLRALAGALKDSYSYNETYARIGADRFVGLVIDDGRLEERRKFITDRIKETTDAIPMKYPVRLKNGMYYVSDRKESVADMIDKANLARKALTGEERNLDSEYRDQLMESTRKQENIESRMESALENGEFVPYLQPKWDMAKNHICGAEALVRWKDGNGKIVPPGDFIPLFEKNGFIEKIDFFMLEEICKYIRKMIDEGREVYPVSINQSRYLMYDPNYISRVQEIFLKYKVPRGLVELELTETVFFQEKDRMISIMNKLKELNMNLSIDDFGSGYSSLNLLRDIPFDVLKIDRGFLDESTQSESGKWILSKIVEMAEGMNLRVVCEGVETEEQVEMLLEIGCKYAQGYLYSRPIPMEEYIEKYDVLIDEESAEEHQRSVECIRGFLNESMENEADVEPIEVGDMDVFADDNIEPVKVGILSVDSENAAIENEISEAEVVAEDSIENETVEAEVEDSVENEAIEAEVVVENSEENEAAATEVVVENSIENKTVEVEVEVEDSIENEALEEEKNHGEDTLEMAVAMPFWLV